jgi:hypothetical protein
MSPELETYCRSGTDTWTDCFDSVLFPLMDELLKAELPFLDPVGLDEARMRASALLCKVFLHFLPVMRQRRELPTLWLRILDYLQCYLSASRNEYLVCQLQLLIALQCKTKLSPARGHLRVSQEHVLGSLYAGHVP